VGVGGGRGHLKVWGTCDPILQINETNLFPISMSTYKLVTVYVDQWSNTLIVHVM